MTQMAMPVKVRGYFTEYADFVYQPKDAEDLADSARSRAYSGQVELLQAAWDLTQLPEAKDAIFNEILHFKHMRTNMACLLPTERHIQHGPVEGEIYFAISEARIALRSSPVPLQPSQVRIGVGYRIANPLKRERSDSNASQEAPPARRAKVVHLTRPGQNPQKVWERQERERRAAGN